MSSEEDDYFEHPQRFELNVPGPFYTTGQDGRSDCLDCGAPEMEAPTLLAPDEERGGDTYFARQPTSAVEIEQACVALECCCASALRYGGRNVEIIRRLGNDPSLTDYIEASSGELHLGVVLAPRAQAPKTLGDRVLRCLVWLLSEKPAPRPRHSASQTMRFTQPVGCPHCNATLNQARRLGDGRTYVCPCCHCSWEGDDLLQGIAEPASPPR